MTSEGVELTFVHTDFSKRHVRRSNRGSWRGLYALIPLTAILLLLAARLKLRGPLHQILLVGVVLVVAVLAFLWSEGHADLMGSEGADAEAETSELSAAGIEPGRFAPSITALQAHYRQVMFSRHSPGITEGRRLPKHER